MVSQTAWWQSGYAEDCKSLDAGSIPTQASKLKAASAAFILAKYGQIFYEYIQ